MEIMAIYNYSYQFGMFRVKANTEQCKRGIY